MMNAKMDNIQWLSIWFQKYCDGEREQQYGIDIQTLDNPGWSVKIDLHDTPFSCIPFTQVEREWEVNHWISCFVRNECFWGFCGMDDLNETINIFKEWINQE